jgi:class 3 adenylate cyclase
VLGVFGAPEQLSHPESRAAFAALHGLDRLKTIMQDKPKGQRLTLRAGLGSSVVLSAVFGPEIRREYGIVGRAGDLARSLGAIAPAWSALVSDRIQEQLPEQICGLPRGDLDFNLHGERVGVYELTAGFEREPLTLIDEI